jgi:polyphosphate glucokinase
MRKTVAKTISIAGRAGQAAGPTTLCIDIGGTGIKTLRVSAQGRPLGERARVDTPHPATRRAMADALRTIVPDPGSYDRVSVGFPGVVKDGVVRTAPNLDPSWAGVDLARAIEKVTGKPTRALNDAGVQGYGAIRGRGVEVCITLGTSMGFALFLDGRYVPNIELGHHPFRKGKTYEDVLGKKALARLGKKRWNRMLERAIAQIEHTFNFDTLYVGGGNAARVTIELPPNVRRVENVAGLLGGVKLWERG